MGVISPAAIVQKSLAAPVMTINVNQFAVSRSQTVIVTGSDTAWTSGTTFSVSGGTAPSISGTTVNTGAQTASFTLNPGPGTGTLTISNSTDSATTTVSVSNSVTVSGSNLTTWDVGPVYLFDPVKEFTPNAVGHTITISGGTGFTPGIYTIDSVTMGQFMGAQGTHNAAVVLKLNSTTEGAASGPASGGSWSYVMASGGSGFAGSNLTPWSRAGGEYYFDPDAPLSPAMNGTTITISGPGFTTGTYTVTGFFSNFATGSQGSQNLISVAQIGGNYPSAIGAEGGTWTKAGGATIPVATVNTDYTGPIKVMLIGDSITSRQIGDIATSTALEEQFPNASSVVVVNASEPGTTTSSWMPGQSRYDSAVSQANSADITVVSIMLGTNDSKSTDRVSVATYEANLQAIVDGLFADIPTLQKVVLQEAPYIIPSTSPWDATSNTYTQDYYAAYSSITGNVAVGVSGLFDFFMDNPQLLVDGVHQTTAGGGAINYYWQESMADSIVAAGTPPVVVPPTDPPAETPSNPSGSTTTLQTLGTVAQAGPVVASNQGSTETDVTTETPVESLSVSSAGGSSVQNGGSQGGQRPTFSGLAPAGSTVVVTVHSDPVSCSAVADTTGSWSCTLPTDLALGEHTVDIVATTLDGKKLTLPSFSYTAVNNTVAEINGAANETAAKTRNWWLPVVVVAVVILLLGFVYKKLKATK